MDDQVLHLLTTLGEATGITGLIAATAVILIKMIRRNGCTCSLFSCSGSQLFVLDCEKGAPGKRHNTAESSTDDSASV
jgi:hypothetical protein